jgi:meso-butanediol dehydrogenase/(S,S)-butanediol dehydrogenase/diacetyl reductase
MPDAWIDFSGKIAAVTGAASGIGRATARLLAGFGAEVLLLDRNVDGAQVAAAEISSTGGKASAHALDVTSETEWQSIGQLVASRYSRLDVLVNSAGIATFDRVDDAMFDTYRRAFAINVEGSLHGMAMALGFMRAAGKGAIVNLASTAALKGNPGMASYGASKAAISHFTRSAACELNRAGLDIRVNAVMPGFTETAMAQAVYDRFDDKLGGREATLQVFASGRPADPEEIANLVVFLASDRASFISGSVIAADRAQSA